jgi:hypothetical protein
LNTRKESQSSEIVQAINKHISELDQTHLSTKPTQPRLVRAPLDKATEQSDLQQQLPISHTTIPPPRASSKTAFKMMFFAFGNLIYSMSTRPFSLLPLLAFLNPALQQ